jgi:NAD(P)H-nitrite reductase large subunit
MRHLILGNGPAGVIAAERIRHLRPNDSIVLVGSENSPPYSRLAIPYLLVGNISEEGTFLRKDANHYLKLKIDQKKAQAIKIDSQKQLVTFDNSESVAYDRLLIATGSVPIRPPIPGIDLPGVYSCWTLEDARAIKRLMKPGARILQMGAGFIGCIILEALAGKDVELTVVEMGDRMVPRMMTEVAGGLIKRWVEEKGIKVHTNTKVESIIKNKTGLQVALSNGNCIDTDLVISATGVKPNIAFLKDSNLNIRTGIVVNDQMQTSDPNIFAAGDVTESIDFCSGQPIINAIQPNAADQAMIAATNMAGGDAKTRGALQINVLDTLGLISCSFGQWAGVQGGQYVEHSNPEKYQYIRLEFDQDRLIGATSLGLTDHVGAMRGLIQTRTALGEWKDKLLRDPTQIMAAYVAKGQAQII